MNQHAKYLGQGSFCLKVIVAQPGPLKRSVTTAECVTVEVYDMHPGRDANNVTEPRAVGRADPVTGWIKVVKRLSQQQTR